MYEQSDTGVDDVGQLWLTVPEPGTRATGNDTTRTARRDLERAASRALLAKTRASAVPRRSLSHSGGCAAIAIAPVGCQAGVDIEVTTHRDVHSIARFAFAADEVRDFSSLDEPEAITRFYILWTLKEAFAKVLGVPLLTALRDFSFASLDDRWTARFPLVAPWRATVFAPRPKLTLAAVVVGPYAVKGGDWICREWPGDVGRSWKCLATLAGDGHPGQR